MWLPEFLYQLSARDQQVTWLDPVFRSDENAVAAASVDAGFTVPEGRVLLLNNVSIIGVSGAAQTISNLMILARARPGANVIRVAAFTFAAIATQEQNYAVNLLLPSGWTILTRGTFNAGANVNTVAQHLSGLMIPVGNIARL